MKNSYLSTSLLKSLVLAKEIPPDDIRYGIPIYVFEKDKIINVMYDENEIEIRKKQGSVEYDTRFFCFAQRKENTGISQNKLDIEIENEIYELLVQHYSVWTDVGPRNFKDYSEIATDFALLFGLNDYIIHAPNYIVDVFDVINTIYHVKNHEDFIFRENYVCFRYDNFPEMKFDECDEIIFRYVNYFEKNLKSQAFKRPWFSYWKVCLYDLLAKKFPANAEKLNNYKLEVTINKLTS